MPTHEDRAKAESAASKARPDASRGSTLGPQPSCALEPRRPRDVLALQRLAGNSALVQFLPVQRHNDDALKDQLVVEDEASAQAAVQRTPTLAVQRHRISAPAQMGHQASFGSRDFAGMLGVVNDQTLREDVRGALMMSAQSVLKEDPAERARKLQQLQALPWVIREEADFSGAEAAPAQVIPGPPASINIWYKHPNYYFPDGKVRTTFVKSVMLHEGMHYLSSDHQGFQDNSGEKLDKYDEAGSPNDSLDEAVTDAMAAEVAGNVLDPTQPYTTNYWNLQARKGLDYHLTFSGLEALANLPPLLWIGKLIPIIEKESGLTWNAIKTAYMTDRADPKNRATLTAIKGKHGEIDRAWKSARGAALEQQLGPNAIPSNEWEDRVKELAAGVNARRANQTLSRDQIKAEFDGGLHPHEIVSKEDPRSSLKDDWALVRNNTPAIKAPGPMRGTSWSVTSKEASGATPPKSEGFSLDDLGKQQQQKEQAASPKRAAANIDMAAKLAELKVHLAEADKLLGGILGEHDMSWVLVPDDPAIRLETKFTDYPPHAISMLKASLRGKSIVEVSGGKGDKVAIDAVRTDYGGAGYESGSDLAVMAVDELRFSTVLHELGHHKQKYKAGLTEANLASVPGAARLLEFHNLLYSENKVAERQYEGDKGSDPEMRFGYKLAPISQKRSEWCTLAKLHQPGKNYELYKTRILLKGGEPKVALAGIEAMLRHGLYDDNLRVLFLNKMIAEIRLYTPQLEVTDVGATAKK